MSLLARALVLLTLFCVAALCVPATLSAQEQVQQAAPQQPRIDPRKLLVQPRNSPRNAIFCHTNTDYDNVAIPRLETLRLIGVRFFLARPAMLPQPV